MNVIERSMLTAIFREKKNPARHALSTYTVETVTKIA